MRALIYAAATVHTITIRLFIFFFGKWSLRDIWRQYKQKKKTQPIRERNKSVGMCNKRHIHIQFVRQDKRKTEGKKNCIIWIQNHNNNSWCDSRTVLKNWLAFFTAWLVVLFIKCKIVAWSESPRTWSEHCIGNCWEVTNGSLAHVETIKQESHT